MAAACGRWDAAAAAREGPAAATVGSDIATKNRFKSSNCGLDRYYVLPHLHSIRLL